MAAKKKTTKKPAAEKSKAKSKPKTTSSVSLQQPE